MPKKARTNPRRTNSTKRNNLRKQVLAEEHRCALCDQEVDKTLTMLWGHHSPRCTNTSCRGCVPHPKRAEVDEIIPVSRGGDPYNRTNCRLTHRDCNRNRSNKPDKPPPTPLKTTWTW